MTWKDDAMPKNATNFHRKMRKIFSLIMTSGIFVVFIVAVVGFAVAVIEKNCETEKVIIVICLPSE